MWWFLWELLVCGNFSHELLIFGGFFMQIVSMRGFFMHIVSFRIAFSMKKGYVCVWGACKNVWILRVWFLKSKSIKANKCPRLPYFTLLMLGLTVGLTVDSYPFNFAVTLCRFGNPCESWKKILEGERLSKPSDVSWLFFQ